MKTILLTNDDGFFSRGLVSLKEELARWGYRIFIVAPDRERSAISMALTLHHPLRVKEISADVFAIDGTTADCVNIAVQNLLPRKPDFVISGMNLGENLAEDVFFSGTVGGAFSAMLYGIPSLAVSLLTGRGEADESRIDFELGARMTQGIFARLLALADPETVYNLNIPFPCTEKIIITTLGSKRYRPDILERTDPRGRPYYWIGTGSPEYLAGEETDIEAVTRGNASLSPLRYVFNSAEERIRLKNYFIP